jgi:DNA-binding NarL/FixJ family response regulator
MIKVLLATSEPVLGKGLETILHDAGFLVTDVCSDIVQVFDCFQRNRPDIAILDVPLSSRLAVIGELRRLAPKSQLLVWSRQISKEEAKEAIRLGATGVVPGCASLGQLVEALQLLGSFPQPDLTPAEIVKRVCNPTERQLIALVGHGMKNEEIAAVMRFDESSVEKLLKGVSRRIGAVDRYELALYGLSAARESF